MQRHITPHRTPSRHITMFTTPVVSTGNLRRMLALRGISLIIAFAMAMLAEPVLHIEPNVRVLMMVCGVWAVFGAFTWLRTSLPMRFQATLPDSRPYPVRGYELLLHIVMDIVLLTAFLTFCGGTANPLTALYLMPVAVAAAMLSLPMATAAAAFAIAAYALLWVIAVPISVEDMGAAMHMHLVGMWLTFALSSMLLVGIVARMSAALREREQRLVAAQERSMRDERIIALGSLAAGAAHQLGTPLNTATLLADEIASNAPASGDIASDARELRVQIDRCREIVKNLITEAGARRGSEAISISTWITRVVTNFRYLRGDCIPAIDIRDGLESRLLHPEITLTQSLTDLLCNAADASPGEVALIVEADGNAGAMIAICDAGSGFSAQALSHIGHEPWSDKEHGLGLGLYLANATAERFGGTLECRNTATGAKVVVTLPLLAMGVVR